MRLFENRIVFWFCCVMFHIALSQSHVVKENYFPQKIDHFNNAHAGTFLQKYYTCDQYYGGLGIVKIFNS